MSQNTKHSALAHKIDAACIKAQERGEPLAAVIDAEIRPLVEALRLADDLADFLRSHGYVPPCLSEYRAARARIGGAR